MFQGEELEGPCWGCGGIVDHGDNCVAVTAAKQEEKKSENSKSDRNTLTMKMKGTGDGVSCASVASEVAKEMRLKKSGE